MTKQEEIREILISIAMKAHRQPAEDTAGEILSYLHSKGVVIKVDRELPEPSREKVDTLEEGVRAGGDATVFLQEVYRYEGWKELQQTMLKADYVAVEPLIPQHTVAEDKETQDIGEDAIK